MERQSSGQVSCLTGPQPGSIHIALSPEYCLKQPPSTKPSILSLHSSISYGSTANKVSHWPPIEQCEMIALKFSVLILFFNITIPKLYPQAMFSSDLLPHDVQLSSYYLYLAILQEFPTEIFPKYEGILLAQTVSIQCSPSQ